MIWSTVSRQQIAVGTRRQSNAGRPGEDEQRIEEEWATSENLPERGCVADQPQRCG
jgi:hypothetical protein